jgi:hypothetical protein
LSAPGAKHERCRDRSTGRTQGGVYGWFGVLGQQAQVPCDERRGGGAHRLSCGRGGWRQRRRGGGGAGVLGAFGAEGVHPVRDEHHRVRAAQHPRIVAGLGRQSCVAQSIPHCARAEWLVGAHRRVGEAQLVETLHDLFPAHKVSQNQSSLVAEVSRASTSFIETSTVRTVRSYMGVEHSRHPRACHRAPPPPPAPGRSCRSPVRRSAPARLQGNMHQVACVCKGRGNPPCRKAISGCPRSTRCTGSPEACCPSPGGHGLSKGVVKVISLPASSQRHPASPQRHPASSQRHPASSQHHPASS